MRTVSDLRRQMVEYGRLMRMVLYREVVFFLRYPANALGGVLVFAIFFAMLFFGGRAVAANALADSIEGLVVGYMLFTMATAAYGELATDITKEAQWGTLERHFMTPFGFAPLMVAKGVAKVTLSFVVGTLMLVFMLAITQTALHINLLTIVPVLVFALGSVLGVGLAMGGVAVLYKQISEWVGLLQFGFVPLIAAPEFAGPWANVLPLVQGSLLLQRAMTDGVRLWEFSSTSLLVLVGTAVGYVLVGYVVFTAAHRRARRLGVLGDY